MNRADADDARRLGPEPDGVPSILDTDLYKLTMQCAVLKFFPRASMLNLLKVLRR